MNMPVEAAGKAEKRNPKLMHIEIHPMKGGHMVRHVMDDYSGGKNHVFGKGEGSKLMAHIAKHAKVAMESGENERADNAKEEAEEGE